MANNRELSQLASKVSVASSAQNTLVGLGTTGSLVLSVGSVSIGATFPYVIQTGGGTSNAIGRIYVGIRSDLSPNASGDGYLRFLGNGYTGYITLDSNGIRLGTNSNSRSVILDTDETKRVEVTGAGYLLIPNQPAFQANGTGTTSFSGSQVFKRMQLGATTVNTSSSYGTSNSRFTAPVSGNYFFGLSSATTTATSTGPAIFLYKNNVAVREIALNYTNINFTQFGGVIISTADAGDFFEFFVANFNGTSFTIDLFRTNFTGFLIG
jgi:hypothetical protein